MNEVIKYLRNQKGWTRIELAKRLDVSGPSVSDWESGKKQPKQESLIRLAKVFNLTLDQLINYRTHQNQKVTQYWLKELNSLVDFNKHNLDDVDQVTKNQYKIQEILENILPILITN